MEKSAQKKILVAVDGSVYSCNSLDYLIKLFKDDREIVFHLLSIVSGGNSDQNWMLDVDPLRGDTPAVEMRKAKANRYLKDARNRFMRNNFTEEQVEYSAESSAASISTAIHHFANQGMYDGLLIGRRGVGKVGEMFLGSVSADLIRKCHELPVWLIDGEVTSTRFLLSVHCAPQSLLAADHLAFLVAGTPGIEICLYHSSSVFGSTPPASPEDFHAQWGKEWCDKYLDEDRDMYKTHARVLTENGISEEKITTIPPRKDLDASHDLLRQAKKHGCGTVVIGRRGREVEKGLLGGVSDRTTQQAQNMAVWLVG